MTKAKARPSKPVGEWNTMEIQLRGPRTTVKLNGVEITDYDGVTPVPEKVKTYEPDRGKRPDVGTSPSSTMAARVWSRTARSR
jgi:hypothetical protein